MSKKTASEKVEDKEIVIDVDEPELTVEDLPGVGPATAEKLREAGFEELLAIAVMSPSELAEQAELGEAVSAKIIAGAKKMANICLLYTSPSPRDATLSRMPSSA